MDASAIALQSLQQADAQLNQAAAEIASYSTPAPDGSAPDPVSLSASIVALISARNNFAANLDTLKAAEFVQKQVLDVTA